MLFLKKMLILASLLNKSIPRSADLTVATTATTTTATSNKRLSSQLFGGDPFAHLNAKEATNTSSDDIYYNIVPIESDEFASSPPESNYTDDTFFNPLSASSSAMSPDNVYDIIVKDQAVAASATRHQPMRRDFVMREILNTEENFVAGLNTLMQDFLIPLSRVLKEPDRKIICINLDRLIELHTRLRNALTQACKGGQGRTQRICLVFESFKVKTLSKQFRPIV